MWYALGVGGGKWVEIREAPKPPKACLTSLKIGDRLFHTRTFRGGTTKAVVTRTHFRAALNDAPPLVGVKRITKLDAEKVMS